MNQSEINVGIDTPSTLDIGVLPSREFLSVDNNQAGIKRAIEHIKKLQPTRVLIEATGRLETPFVVAAFKAKLSIAIGNALQFRRFAEASGQFAKTHRIDAFIIAKFGQKMEPRFTQVKLKDLQLISDLLTYAVNS